MKLSKSLIAIAVVATLPLAAFAGEKDKTMSPMAASSAAQFKKMDSNGDGRLSQTEASSDSKIVFATVDKNGDGYLDNSEYMHRDMMKDDASMPKPNGTMTPRQDDSTMPDATKPTTDPTTPRQ